MIAVVRQASVKEPQSDVPVTLCVQVPDNWDGLPAWAESMLIRLIEVKLLDTARREAQWFYKLKDRVPRGLRVRAILQESGNLDVWAKESW